MDNGWIKLHRKLQNNFLWKEKRVFSKAEAWIDILWEVQHMKEPQKVILGMRVLTCNRGESLNSLKTWANRWKWSKSTTRRFLEVLRGENMIRLKSETVTVRLSVCNYDLYNIAWNGDETQVKRIGNASETQVAPDKKEENVNTEKKETGGRRPQDEKEVVKYAAEMKYVADPRRFFAFYEERDWEGVNNWKLKLRTWHLSDEKEKEKKQLIRRGPNI